MDLPPNPELSEVSPFISIWTKPRQTMRWIVDTEPTKNVILLASVSGIFQALNLASGIDLGDVLALWLVFLICLILGPIGGVIGLYLGGWLYSWSGRKLGGTGDSRKVRSALAWGAIPGMIGQILYWVFALFVYGEEIFASYAPTVDTNPTPLFIVYYSMLFFGIWGAFVLYQCLGEVHEFSAWRAWGAMIVGGLVIFVPIFLLSLCSIGFIVLIN